MKNLLSTRAVARLLNINEKAVYGLIAEKGLPATKITGKWLFPQHLAEQWIENHTVNFPDASRSDRDDRKLLVIAGSNDILLDKVVSEFNRRFPDHMAVFGNLGSMGGLKALKNNLAHIACCHLLQEDADEYNFEFAGDELERMPAIVNFCLREQGLLTARDNPKNIKKIEDLSRPGIKIVNRPPGTGTRLLLDRELTAAGIVGDKIEGYRNEVARHLDAGLEILNGRADAGLAIRPVASLLGLGFVPVRWERFDLLVSKDRFFDKKIQLFLGLARDSICRRTSEKLEGYDLGLNGKIIFPEKTG